MEKKIDELTKKIVRIEKMVSAIYKIKVTDGKNNIIYAGPERRKSTPPKWEKEY